MTIDVEVKKLDEAFLDDIDEIMEDTMVQLFIVHPKTAEEVEEVQEEAQSHNSIFYALPTSLHTMEESKCIGYSVTDPAELDGILGKGKIIFIDERDLSDPIIEKLQDTALKGIILNATSSHPELEHFHLALGPESVKTFDSEMLNALSMDRIVLKSGYPEFGFDTLMETAKTISDAMFRPEQSIIARATKSTLELCNLR